MEPVIGIFASRNSAEYAVGELLKRDVPRQAVDVLTVAEEQHRVVGEQMGAYIGVLAGVGVGMSLGVITAVQLGMLQFAPLLLLGFGAAAVLGLSGGVMGRLIGRAAVQCVDKKTGSGLPRERAVVVVTTDSAYVATCAQTVFAKARRDYVAS